MKTFLRPLHPRRRFGLQSSLTRWALFSHHVTPGQIIPSDLPTSVNFFIIFTKTQRRTSSLNSAYWPRSNHVSYNMGINLLARRCECRRVANRTAHGDQHRCKFELRKDVAATAINVNQARRLRVVALLLTFACNRR